jgi:glycosyltransferase involved in cell wall biosynthesis
MKKVLFVIDTLEVGGAEQSILEIASRFKHYVPLICHLYPGESLRSAYEQHGIRVISLNTPGQYNFKEAFSKLGKVVKAEQPDIIHSTLFRSDWVCRKISRRFNIPLINSFVNDSYSADRYNKLSWKGKLKLKAVEYMDRFTAGSVSHFISNSEAIKRSNAGKLHVREDKITVIYRGRDFHKFNIPATLYLHRELNLQSNAKIMLNVSRLLERKGQRDLLRAFKPIADEFGHVILVIVGEGPYKATLQATIQELNLQGRVFLTGTRNDIPSLLAESSWFVFPSHFEGLPGALIEAMMAKKIIVASAIPENLECVSADSAYLFQKGNVAELTAAIRLALQDQSQAKPENAWRRALEKFEISKISDQYETFYDRLLTS